MLGWNLGTQVSLSCHVALRASYPRSVSQRRFSGQPARTVRGVLVGGLIVGFKLHTIRFGGAASACPIQIVHILSKGRAEWLDFLCPRD
jgi:hypothetical protein